MTIKLKTQPLGSPEELNILHVTPVYEPAYIYGGPTRSIPLLCKALAQQGVKVTVFTTDANGPERLNVPCNRPVISDEGVKVWYYRRNSRGSYHYSWQLGRECARRANEFSLVHSAGIWNYGMVAADRAANQGGIPHIVSVRNALTKWAYDFKSLRKRLYMSLGGERQRLNRASLLHYTTDLERDDSAYLKLRPQAAVVPNPVDLELFKVLPPRGFLRQQLGLTEEAFLFGMVGRIHPKKGCELAVKALATLIRQHPEAHLVLVGPDENNYLSEVIRLAQEYRVESQVHRVEQVAGRDMVAAYSDLDSLLLPSYSESFGNVVVEAMAGARPVLISDQVGVAPEVAQAGAGKVFPLTVPALEAAMSELIGRADRGQEWGKNGQLLAWQHYTPEAVASATLEMYRQVLPLKAR